MALTYEESAALMTDQQFRGRIKVACLKYADSIMNEANTVPAHNTRLKWAQQCFQQPDMAAANVQPPVVMDPAVQVAGAEITDAALQGSVETVVNKMM
jgi:hypothetical protein